MEKEYAPSASERPLSERPVSEGVKSAQSPVHSVVPHGSAIGNGNGSVRAEEPSHRHVAPQTEVYDDGMPPQAGASHVMIFRGILAFGLISWLVALVSQAVVASTLSNAPVRILWFGIIVQTYVLFLVACLLLEGLDVGFIIYGPQITHFAVIATVFAVLGVDQNIYSSESSQQATGAGWLLLAMTDIVLIVFLSGHPDHIVFRLFTMAGGKKAATKPGSHVERIGRSTEAFPMSPTTAGQGAPVDAEAGSVAGGAPSHLHPQTGATAGFWRRSTASANRASTGNRLSKSRPLSQARQSRVTMSDVGSAVPSAAGGDPNYPYGHVQPHPGAVPPMKTVSEATSPDAEAKWRAVALYDYKASDQDPNEFDFKRNDILLVFEKTGKWWECKHPNTNKKGVAPSNYLKLLE